MPVPIPDIVASFTRSAHCFVKACAVPCFGPTISVVGAIQILGMWCYWTLAVFIFCVDELWICSRSGCGHDLKVSFEGTHGGSGTLWRSSVPSHRRPSRGPHCRDCWMSQRRRALQTCCSANLSNYLVGPKADPALCDDCCVSVWRLGSKWVDTAAASRCICTTITTVALCSRLAVI